MVIILIHTLILVRYINSIFYELTVCLLDKSSTFEKVGCDECQGFGSRCNIAEDKCVVGVSYLEGSEWKGKRFLTFLYKILTFL